MGAFRAALAFISLLPAALAWSPVASRGRVALGNSNLRSLTTRRQSKDNPDEETFIMIKPDGVVRGLAGSFLARCINNGICHASSTFDV
jgi:hypothetical protein